MWLGGFLALLLCASAAWADRVEEGVKDAAPSGLRAGVARADLTPPADIAHINWGAQTHLEAAGLDPSGMTATALVVSDGKQKVALVAVDILGVDVLEEARRRAAERIGVPVERIRLAASHTHAGPQVSRTRGPAGADYDRYEPVLETHLRAAVDKIVGAIVEADRRLQPVHVSGSRGTGSININRRRRAEGERPAAVGRNPEGFVDRDLVVIRIDKADGSPLAVLVNYACHATVLSHENQLISPDWPGAMRRTVEAALPGAKCLFLQGAAGNQGPVEGFTGDLSVAHRLGTILGLEAAALALRTETVRRQPRFEGFTESGAFLAREPWRVSGPRDGTLRFAMRTIEVPRRRHTAEEIEDMRRRVADAEKRLEAAKLGGDAWTIHQAQVRLRRVSNLLASYQQPPNPSPLALELAAVRIGETAILTMPGEPFAEIGAAVKKRSPFAVTMFNAYASGAGGGYMPVASEYPHGGYEIEITPYAPEAADIVIAQAAKLLAELR
jgi:hypothetical protein